MSRILDLLELTPSRESVDYVDNKGQFHLHSLLTEQRHEKTWDLSTVVGRDAEAGLRAILSVDADLERRVDELARDPAPLEQMASAITAAVRRGRRIYVYGCGATGRLAKQLESIWRPFWRRLGTREYWPELAEKLPAGIADALVGEMTGGDRALVSSLEGFEDLMLLGELQLADHGIARSDVVICVTEGGETSSVIGTILAALADHGELDELTLRDAREHLYFVYNNPDSVLRPFERSRRVLDEPAITRINLATGPQAIAGSTRMQATTIETFVVGVALEEAVFRLLREHLEPAQLEALGFAGDPGIAGRLRAFPGIRAAVDVAVPALARLTERESAVYAGGGRATYFAHDALVAVFTDCTERSPTFRLFPLDKVDAEERRSWVQVWTEGEDARSAWRSFLGRPFRGLDAAFYRPPLAEVEDPYLRQAALASLQEAGQDQEQRYDFALSAHNLAQRRPGAGDLGVLVLIDGEIDEISRDDSAAARFLALCRESGAGVAVLRAAGQERLAAAPVIAGDSALVDVVVEDRDPLTLRRQIAVKILLNAHSTAAMARLGRVIGNTMTNVSPSNLKLVGRATFLIQSHVNDVLAQARWAERHGAAEPVSFAEANAVLYDSISWVRTQGIGQTAEVALCIVRIVESLARGVGVDWEAVRKIAEDEGLAAFLQRHNPALGGADE